MIKFRFCPECGTPLTARDLGDDKDVPWCESCGRPWFPLFPLAIITLVYNDNGEVLLLKQNYISREFHNLVSGYISPGEDAESCARREIFEETGLRVDKIEIVMTSWFAKKDMMMIGFFAHTSERDLKLSSEVDSAAWYPMKDVLSHLSTRPGSTSRILAERFIVSKAACVNSNSKNYS